MLTNYMIPTINKIKISIYYEYKVGVRNLDIFKNEKEIQPYNHVCIKLRKDIFEYGVNSEENDKKKYERHKNVGWDPQFDWHYLGKQLNGVTEITPDDLELAIKKDGVWGPGSYNILSHNCHDFVQFCLRILGCAKYKYKTGPCYMPNIIEQLEIENEPRINLYKNKSINRNSNKN